MSGFVELSWNDWYDQFQPIQNLLSSETDQFETYGEELNAVNFCLAFFPLHVWTLIDGEDGELFVTNGKRFCNRINYYITEIPAVPNVCYEIFDD